MPIPSRKKAEFLARIGSAKYTIQRSKGLGENDAEMMWLTTMNPASRRLIKGDAHGRRRPLPPCLICFWATTSRAAKEHIAQHGHEYLDELDVS